MISLTAVEVQLKKIKMGKFKKSLFSYLAKTLLVFSNLGNWTDEINFIVVHKKKLIFWYYKLF